jgi:hypothetical protein
MRPLVAAWPRATQNAPLELVVDSPGERFANNFVSLKSSIDARESCQTCLSDDRREIGFKSIFWQEKGLRRVVPPEFSTAARRASAAFQLTEYPIGLATAFYPQPTLRRSASFRPARGQLPQSPLSTLKRTLRFRLPAPRHLERAIGSLGDADRRGGPRKLKITPQ